MSALKSILLAEDSPKDVELTLEALSEYHLANEVAIVQDGAEALEYLFSRGAYADRPPGLPVLVMLDLKMPRVDGMEVLRQIKAEPSMKHIAVVMLTSSREERDLVRSYELGVNSYVVKPVQFQSFMDAVRYLGVYWALINEPPPGTSRPPRPKDLSSANGK